MHHFHKGIVPLHAHAFGCGAQDKTHLGLFFGVVFRQRNGICQSCKGWSHRAFHIHHRIPAYFLKPFMTHLQPRPCSVIGQRGQGPKWLLISTILGLLPCALSLMCSEVPWSMMVTVAYSAPHPSLPKVHHNNFHSLSYGRFLCT